MAVGSYENKEISGSAGGAMAMIKKHEDLARVGSAIGPAIEAFFVARWFDVGLRKFHMQELYDYVKHDHQVAPASVDRILRSLRQQGRVGYEVVKRSESLYEITSVTGCRRQQSFLSK